jgi:hypothetical protein
MFIRKRRPFDPVGGQETPREAVLGRRKWLAAAGAAASLVGAGYVTWRRMRGGDQAVDHQPATFWSTMSPQAYPFESNVDPAVPRPWPQHSEMMLGSGDRYPTQRYNGYEEYVAGLYAAG